MTTGGKGGVVTGGVSTGDPARIITMEDTDDEQDEVVNYYHKHRRKLYLVKKTTMHIMEYF